MVNFVPQAVEHTKLPLCAENHLNFEIPPEVFSIEIEHIFVCDKII